MALRSKANMTKSLTKKVVGTAVVAAVCATAAFVVPFAGTAGAAPAVTIPTGNPADGQTFTVTGTGFPTPTADPSGLQILECSDPSGTTANLPQDNSGCDAISISQGFIGTDSNGNFTTQYTAMLLNSGNSTINCDQTHFCVLWVGVDYLNQFTSGPHAFSRAFEIGAAPAMTPEAALAIALPVTAALVAGGAYFVVRRRRQQATAA